MFVANLIIQLLCIRYMRQLITADVLEHAEVKSIKETMRSILSSVALVSALVLTIAFACLQVLRARRRASAGQSGAWPQAASYRARSSLASELGRFRLLAVDARVR